MFFGVGAAACIGGFFVAIILVLVSTSWQNDRENARAEAIHYQVEANSLCGKCWIKDSNYRIALAMQCEEGRAAKDGRNYHDLPYDTQRRYSAGLLEAPTYQLELEAATYGELPAKPDYSEEIAAYRELINKSNKLAFMAKLPIEDPAFLENALKEL